MKLTKMSLVAALLIGSSAFAIENTKVSGDAKLFYSTQDSDGYDLFSKGNVGDSGTYGEAALSVGLTTDLTTGISAGATLNAISTLGLYNNLVGGTWTGGTEDTFWFSEAWLAGTAGNTTAKVGRMQLDTPLVFSETWSVAPNTFEAGVLINTDVPDTTLVGAYVGQSSGAAVLGGGLSNATSPFASFHQGAYAIGAVNNSFEPLTAQAWYYNANKVLTAYWLQADLACQLVEGLSFGAQYTAQELKATGSETQSAYAAKLGYEMKDTFSASVAYSQVDDAAGLGNVGANLDGSQSKLYTEAWWNYGVISQPDTAAYNVTVTAPVASYDLGLYVTQATTTDGVAVGTDADFTEATFEVAKSYGPLDTGVYYIYTKNDTANSGDAYNTLQVYLTYNF